MLSRLTDPAGGPSWTRPLRGARRCGRRRRAAHRCRPRPRAPPETRWLARGAAEISARAPRSMPRNGSSNSSRRADRASAPPRPSADCHLRASGAVRPARRPTMPCRRSASAPRRRSTRPSSNPSRPTAQERDGHVRRDRPAGTPPGPSAPRARGGCHVERLARGAGGERATAEQRLALGDRPRAEQGLEERRLAGAEEPEDTDDLPFAHDKVERRDGRSGCARRAGRGPGPAVGSHEVRAPDAGRRVADRGLGMPDGRGLRRRPERRAEDRRADLAGGRGPAELTDEAPVAQHAHAVHETGDLAQPVRDVEHGHTQPAMRRTWRTAAGPRAGRVPRWAHRG